MDKLKDCPFCGYDDGYVDVYRYPQGYRVEVSCARCGARVESMTYKTEDIAKERAFALWNARVNE